MTGYKMSDGTETEGSSNRTVLRLESADKFSRGTNAKVGVSLKWLYELSLFLRGSVFGKVFFLTTGPTPL